MDFQPAMLVYPRDICSHPSPNHHLSFHSLFRPGHDSKTLADLTNLPAAKRGDGPFQGIDPCDPNKKRPTVEPIESMGRFVYLPTFTSWWLNHTFEKYARQIGSFPQVGVNIKKIFETTT